MVQEKILKAFFINVYMGIWPACQDHLNKLLFHHPTESSWNFEVNWASGLMGQFAACCDTLCFFLVAWFHCERAESSNGRHFIWVFFLWDDTITNLTHCLTENQIFVVQSLINRIYIYARYLRRK